MGISVASAVAGPAVLASKGSMKAADDEEVKAQQDERTKQGEAVPRKTPGILLENTTPLDARWSDLLKGDEKGNAAVVDVGKLQMFFFTFVLATGYAAVLATTLGTSAWISSLPEVAASTNVLLGISHTGYLATKATTTTKVTP
jgi:hypothetical protein